MTNTSYKCPRCLTNDMVVEYNIVGEDKTSKLVSITLHCYNEYVNDIIGSCMVYTSISQWIPSNNYDSTLKRWTDFAYLNKCEDYTVVTYKGFTFGKWKIDS